METLEGNTTTPSQKPQPLLGFALDSDSFTDTEALSWKSESCVGLRSNDAENDHDHDDDDQSGRLYPLRPYAEDCTYYVRTGMCKFGLNCRFNHPVRRTNQVLVEKLCS